MPYLVVIDKSSFDDESRVKECRLPKAQAVEPVDRALCNTSGVLT